MLFLLLKNGLISQTSISGEQLILPASFTPHVNRKMTIPIGVSNNMYA